MATSLKLVQTINAPAAQLYRAFTNATALREWLCETATTDPKPGGRFFVAWDSGYYASGEYIKLLPDREVHFIWNGRDDPAPTRVQVYINALDNGATTLTLEHVGLDSTPNWEKARSEISHGWNVGMKNLISVLEEGPDLRIVNRPMLGLVFSDYNAKRAKELGVPVETGLRLDSVVEGMGAQKAGLQKNDVIISLNGKPIPDFPAIVTTLQSLEAGNKVEVGFYRGADKKRATMELSRRPLPEIPATPAAFGEAVQAISKEADALLANALHGVSEEEANFKPAPDEWSIKEVIAHFIHGERDTQSFINDCVFSQERVSDGYSDNLPARIAATVHAYKTLPTLVEELKRQEAETAYIVAHLPEEFAARKGSYWRLAFYLLQFPAHAKEHAGQIKDNLVAARGPQK